MAWLTTKDGRHFNTDWLNGDNNKPIISKHSGDEISLSLALDTWARNASGIKAASRGEQYDGSVFGRVGLNDEAKAEQIQRFVKGHTEKNTIYRGLEDISDEQYKQYTKVGSDYKEPGLSSWSTDKKTATGYGTHGKNNIVFIKESATKDARSIGNRVGTDTEKEVIVDTMKSKISKVEKSKYTTYVYLK